MGDDATVTYEGSGSGSGDGPPASSGHYPPDDEDAYTSGKGDRYNGENFDDDEDIYLYNNNRGKGNNNNAYEGSGAGWDSDRDDYEGSGGYVRKTHKPTHENKPARKPPGTQTHDTPKGEAEQPPSGASKETMSLKRAITIYMLPAIIMFLGSLA